MVLAFMEGNHVLAQKTLTLVFLKAPRLLL